MKFAHAMAGLILGFSLDASWHEVAIGRRFQPFGMKQVEMLDAANFGVAGGVLSNRPIRAFP